MTQRSWASGADLFPETREAPAGDTWLGGATLLLRGFACREDTALLDAVEEVASRAAFRHLETPGGFTMSVAMTNCGNLGWVSDRSGYRYESHDPLTGNAWPGMPDVCFRLASRAAMAAGFGGFRSNVCLVNLYEPGARLSLHQDRDEGEFDQPIVSVSLGIPAVFLFGGLTRSAPTRKVMLHHGDVVVWGGPDRLRYHGVLPVRDDRHPLLGRRRINLTFRHAALEGLAGNAD